MTLVDWLYAVISLGDVAILITWGLIDVRTGHRRDGLFLMAIGFCGLTAYGLGHYRESLLSAQIAVADSNAATARSSVAAAILKQKAIETDNLKLALTIETERKERLQLETILQDFKILAEFSDEALAGSSRSYDRLLDRARENSELGQRARERVKYIERERERAGLL